MTKYKGSASLIHDIGALAGLYRTVFWMMGQRRQRGPDWEEQLTEEALRVQALERTGDQHIERSAGRN